MQTQHEKIQIREDQLKVFELKQGDRQHSYNLTQRLTFFLISIEIIFCGYLLLNSEKLGVIKFSSILFLLSGLAAIFGLFWRFCYNQIYHENVHGKQSRRHSLIRQIQLITYWMYVGSTILFFMGTVFVGYNYIYSIEHGMVISPNKNKLYIQHISNDISKVQSGLESISRSIKNLSELRPQIIIQTDMNKKSLPTKKLRDNSTIQPL